MAQRKTFIPLENNPAVMTTLAHKLGMSEELEFQDVYTLTESDLLAFIPRPARALLFVYPETDTNNNFRKTYDSEPDFDDAGDKPVLFYRQIITHACGLIGLLHCITNGARDKIAAGSDLDKLIEAAIPLKPDDRAQLLHDSDMLETAHAIAAQQGDSVAPALGEDPHHAFIAFVKGTDGHLYELEGNRKGPVDKGLLSRNADVLSEEAIKLGPMPFIDREAAVGSNMRFSCIVLA